MLDLLIKVFAVYTLTWALGMNCPEIFAQEASPNEDFVRYSSPSPIPKYSYFGALGVSFPVSRSSSLYTSGSPQPMFGVRYHNDKNFMAGMGIGFRHFKKKKRRNLAVLALTQDLLKTHLMKFPWYGYWGIELSYLMPALSAKVPIEREPELEIEIGAGAKFGLMHLFRNSSWASFEYGFWRGTKTRKIMAGEMRFIYGFPY